MSATTNENLAYRTLVSEDLWTRLTNRIVKDEGLEIELAERIMNEALGFLHFCATHPGKTLGPSPLVDIGWHTFILYTREYAHFCDRYAGGFLHHTPNDVPGIESVAEGFSATWKIMADNGYTIDEMLWVNVLHGHPQQGRVLAAAGGGCTNDCTVDCDQGAGPGQNCTCGQ